MNSTNIAITIVGMMSGILVVILGVINILSAGDDGGMKILLGSIYLLSGLTITGVNIFRLIVKK